MSAGITRVHGTAVMPSQRPSTISFFNVTTSTNMTTNGEFPASHNAPTGGAYDTMFRVAISKFATVAMIGTPTWNGSNATFLNFAIEDTGTLSDVSTSTTYAPSGLGFGSAVDMVNYTAVKDALQAAIRACGTSASGYDMTAMVVNAGVAATVNTKL